MLEDPVLAELLTVICRDDDDRVSERISTRELVEQRADLRVELEKCRVVRRTCAAKGALVLQIHAVEQERERITRLQEPISPRLGWRVWRVRVDVVEEREVRTTLAVARLSRLPREELARDPISRLP